MHQCYLSLNTSSLTGEDIEIGPGRVRCALLLLDLVYLCVYTCVCMCVCIRACVMQCEHGACMRECVRACLCVCM